MAEIAHMPKTIKHGEKEISLVSLYIELELLKKQVVRQEQTLGEILQISKENQEKLKSIDNIKMTFKNSWKFFLMVIFISFMLGLAVDNKAIVTSFYHYFSLN